MIVLCVLSNDGMIAGARDRGYRRTTVKVSIEHEQRSALVAFILSYLSWPTEIANCCHFEVSPRRAEALRALWSWQQSVLKGHSETPSRQLRDV